MANWVILIVRGGIKIVNWVRRKCGNEEIWELVNGKVEPVGRKRKSSEES